MLKGTGRYKNRGGWKGAGYRRKSKCERCKSRKDLMVHHKDRDNSNNLDFSNLITLCRICHVKDHEKEINRAKRTPKFRKRISETQKAAWLNKKSRKARLLKQKQYWEIKENRLRQAKLTRQIFKNPTSKRKLIEGARKSWTKERRDDLSKRNIERYQNGTFSRIAFAKRVNELRKNKKFRERLSQKLKAGWVKRRNRQNVK